MKAVSKTAYYCCGVRMQDAESAHPLIGDQYAKRLLGKEGAAYWEEFKQFTWPNASNTARCYLIDSWVKQELNSHPDATIILIGAGLDSRAYRFNAGRWVEIDEPAIISYKNEILPLKECSNELQRIPIEFEKERLADKLQAYVHRSFVIFIIEGVLMYLSNEQKNQLLSVLTALFPKHILFCDLMSRKFYKKFGGKIQKNWRNMVLSLVILQMNQVACFSNTGILKSHKSHFRRLLQISAWFASPGWSENWSLEN